MSTLHELKAQKAEIEEKIKAALAFERPAAVDRVKALVHEFALTEAEVFGRAAAKREHKPVPAKYRNPESGVTWSGRGKPPTWIAGKDREQFVI